MSKKLSCRLCWLPLILLLIAYVPLFVMAIALGMNAVAEQTVMYVSLFSIVVAVIALIVMYGVMIWLIVKVYKNNNFTGKKKAMWFLCLYFFGMFAFPVYWHKIIRNE